MSIKRQATTDLNHENWDQEDSKDPEEMGTFKTASKDVLEKRVIRTAKRRSQITGDEPKKSVFSGFGGFNKVQQSSFDFLANLTNGNKTNNNGQTKSSDTAVSSSIFTNKSLASSPSTGFFSMSGSSGFASKATLSKSPESLFGGAASDTSRMQSVFTGSKADSTVNDSPFKLQASPSAKIDLATKSSVTPDVSTSQVSSTIFGAPTNTNANKSLFSTTNNSSPLFSTQTVSSTSTLPTNSATTTKVDSVNMESNFKLDEAEGRRLIYHSKLKGLNQSVSDWIKKHVEETPLCILSPIFHDYEKYLREIQTEYKGGESSTKNNNESKLESKSPEETKCSPVHSGVSTSIFGNTTAENPKIKESSQQNSSGITSIFGNTTVVNPKITESPQQNSSGTLGKSSSISFGVNTSTTTTSNTGFSFGINSSASTASSLFSVNTTTTTNVSTPFSFGINKGSFGTSASSPPKMASTEETKDEDDEPPKVEYTPVIEENSVFDKKCKIFIKKDGNFVDKGVGTLYIKKIEETGKIQLLVRANTNLGTVLLNFILSSSIPTQRMGKNNVMLVCIPTPDAQPPPTPILIRVKTSEEADELYNILNKYKA